MQIRSSSIALAAILAVIAMIAPWREPTTTMTTTARTVRSRASNWGPGRSTWWTAWTKARSRTS